MCNAKNTDATKATLLLLMRPKISSFSEVIPGMVITNSKHSLRNM